MDLGAPWMLLFAIPVAAVLAASWRAAVRRRRAGMSGLLLRSLAALLLALAAGGLLYRAGGRPRALVLVDRSASLRTTSRSVLAAALTAGRALSPRFDVDYASFADSVVPERLPRLEALVRDAQGLLADPAGTDLAAALDHARARLRPGEPAVIVTDGLTTAPGLAEAALAWRAASPALAILPARAAGTDVALAEIDAPAEARPGEDFGVAVRVRGRPGARVWVSLSASVAGRREELGKELVSIPPGGAKSVRFEPRAPRGGTLELVATASIPDDVESGNNSARAFVRVLGPLRVGLVSRASSSTLPTALKLVGLRHTRIDPNALPADFAAYDVLMIDDVPRSAMKAGELSRLAAFVTGGGGLVVLGGPQSYASGGYFDGGELERALPASMLPPDDKGLFAVLVLDRSGSMGHPAGGGRKKIEMVRTAAGAIAGREAFGKRDRLAVVTFNNRAELLDGPLSPRDEAAARRLRDRLAKLMPAGSTDLVAALERAAAVLASAPRDAARHVILLSDGLPVGAGGKRGAQKPRLLELAAKLAASGATLSTVGTGSEEEDAALLKQLAEKGGGRFHRPTNLQALADVFRRDLSLKRAKVLRGAFRPTLAGRPFPGLPESLPTLEARNRISARKDAWTVLEAPAAAGRGREPLLVAWERGRGRAVCFASSAGSPWNRATFAAGPGRKLLAALTGWAAGRSGRPGCGLALVRAPGGELRIELLARDEKGAPIPGLRPVLRAGGPAAPVELLQQSPARYTAELRLPEGASEIVTVAEDAERGELARGTFAVPYPREIARLGVDHAAVTELARLTGAEVLSSPAELAGRRFARAAGRGWAALAPWLAAIALLVVLGELALRAIRR